LSPPNPLRASASRAASTLERNLQTLSVRLIRPVRGIASVRPMARPWTTPRSPTPSRASSNVARRSTTPIKLARREALLIAIVQAAWIERFGARPRPPASPSIARGKERLERHIRAVWHRSLRLTPDRVALLDVNPPPPNRPISLTLTKLARALPYCWSEQERRVGSSVAVPLANSKQAHRRRCPLHPLFRHSRSRLKKLAPQS